MIKLGIDLVGLGHGDFSAGGLTLTVRRNDFFKKFSGFCQGASSSKIFMYDVPVVNEVEGYDASVLLDLNQFDLKLEIPTAFGLCNPVEFTLELSDGSDGGAIFKATRRASAWGLSTGDVSILASAGQLRMIQKGSWSDYQAAAGESLKKEARDAMNVAAYY
ncbi:MAG: hypothetical protein JSS81_28785 [Acidobacteria bacterium]|nr:hypothetical protein [Acidobacteriota bacterium]